MTREEFNLSELDIVGEFPAMESFRMPMPGLEHGMPAMPKRNTPVTPKENLKLLLSGQKPYWFPYYAHVMHNDKQDFRPRENMDNVANHQVFDGGAYYSYDGMGNCIVSDWFDLEWEYDEECHGATVRPGNCVLDEDTILEWEKVLHFPDLDAVDWEACGKRNQKLLDGGKFNVLGIQCGFWERLMALMETSAAAIALIDEEQQDAVHRFFDKLADFYIDYINRIKAVCKIDAVELHDDWAHQNGPFFSADTAREMIVPYLKRVIDFCHDNGLYYEQHCCGKVEQLLPVFVEMGVDYWCGQQMPVNDSYALAKQYKDEQIAFGVPYPDIPEGADEKQMIQIAENFVEEYKDCRILLFNDRFKPIPPEFDLILYRACREKL